MAPKKDWSERGKGSFDKLFGLLVVLMGVVVTIPAFAQQRNDIVIALDPDGFVDLRFEDEPAPVGIRSGSVLIQSEEAFCNATPASPCHHVINQVRLQLSNFDLGDFDVDDTVIVIEGPIPVTDIGSGVVIPMGTPVFTGAVVDGPDIDPGFRSATSVLPSDTVLIFDVEDQELSVTGQYSVTFDVGGDSLTGVGQIIASGETPWRNRPPIADAGEDQEVVCFDEVVLDGSASFDFENNINSYAWSEGGRTFGFGPTIAATFGLGLHTIQLQVFDTFGGRGTDDVEVFVDDEPPTFTFVPPDITTAVCTDLEIGNATAISCGQQVFVENDAPPNFHVGATVVTWTATSPFGKQTTVEQLVVVELGDDPACCPPFTNVVVGSAGDDVLEGSAGADCILGLDGSDRINTFSGDDLVSGGAGADNIATHSGYDIVFGGPGSDTIDGGEQDDFVDGGGEVDTCSGGTGVNALKDCEIGAFCTAACCPYESCSVPEASGDFDCGPAFNQDQCLTYSPGVVVSVAGHNWECTNGNCVNCASYAGCEPGAGGCPWGVVWTDRGACE